MKIGYGKSRVIWYVLLGAAFGGVLSFAHYFLESRFQQYENLLLLTLIPAIVAFLALLAHRENLVFQWGSRLNTATERIKELMSDVIAGEQRPPVLEDPWLPTCWRDLDCDKEDCPVYGREHARCWLIAGTFCRGQAQGKFAAELKDCRLCQVYQKATADPVREITENFNTMNYFLNERQEQLAEAYDEARNKSEKLAGLVGLSEAALSSMHMAELLQNLLESTASFVGADLGVLFWPDRSNENLVARVTYGLEPGASSLLTTRVGEGITGQAFAGRYIAVSENVAGDGRVDNEYLKSLQVRTLINLPLPGRDQPLGMLTLGTLTPHHYTEEEKDSLYVAADRIASAIESSQLVGRLGRDRGQLELMAAVTKDPGSPDSVNSIYESFVNHAGSLIDFDRSSLDLWHPETGEIEIVAMETRAPRSWLNQGIRLPGDALPIGKVIESRRPLVREDITGDEYPADRLLLQEGIRSAILLPLISKGEVLGSINLGSFQPDAFSQEDADILEPVAWQLGLIMDNARLVREAKRLSLIDSLTELYNHRYFYEVLVREIVRSKRYGRPVSLIIIDIDGFKAFNERYGRMEGNSLLRAIADTLRSSVREIDITARYGGDEFAVLLPEVSVKGGGPDGINALKIADRLQNEISTKALSGFSGDFALTLSIGVAEFPSHAGDANSLLESAGGALRQAKAAGRDRVVIA